jgi:hypothetical protein
MQPILNVRVHFSWLTQIIKVIGNNHVDNPNKPEKPAEQAHRGLSHESLTFHVNAMEKYYQTFVLLQFFHA